MKKNLNARRLAFVTAALLVVLFVAGCGGSGSGNTAAMPSAAPMAASAGANFATRSSGMTAEIALAEEDAMIETSSGQAAALQNRKVVRHCDFSLETMDFDAGLAALYQMVEHNGGYIESSSMDGASLQYRGSYYERSANITARIPAEKLTEMTGAIEGHFNVTSRTERMDDITDRYFDSEAHLQTLQVQEQRLLEILEKAEKLSDVIELESALSETRYEIESLTAQLKRMDGQVRYSYLNLYLREVVEYEQVSGAPKTFGEKISASFERSGRKIVSLGEDLLFFAIEDLPVLLIVLAIAFVVLFLPVRALIRHSAKRGDKRNWGSSPLKAPAPAAPEQTAQHPDDTQP